ncbi:TIGR00730 family Rossman fold protein [Candidatus Marinamargulisbacteria bacterium SCGC AG-343-D04]|nr:TIGR00730 family Rossman fold protein [Candidatus Marinamargulisbacteria bacterium SCGC AG-343-D04]
MNPVEYSSKKKIHALVDTLLEHADTFHADFLSHTLENLITIQRDDPDPNDLKLIQTALDELVQSFMVFKNYRDTRKVCIFGSARTKPDHPNYTLAENTAKAIVDAGMLVVTGAGPGIMEAGNKGAGHGNSFGLNILLPFEQFPNKFCSDEEKLISYRYFFVRKLTFIKESDAIVLFPGGFGTQDEGFEVLTLIQTGRCSPRPILLINFDQSNYWASWITYIKEQLVDRHYISTQDICLIKEVSTVDELIQNITHFYSTYHSIKYNEDHTIIRLNKKLSPKLLDDINSNYNHLLSSGSFEQISSGHEVNDTFTVPDNPRLVFHFDRHNFGGLCQLIYHINDHNSN